MQHSKCENVRLREVGWFCAGSETYREDTNLAAVLHVRCRNYRRTTLGELGLYASRPLEL